MLKSHLTTRSNKLIPSHTIWIRKKRKPRSLLAALLTSQFFQINLNKHPHPQSHLPKRSTHCHFNMSSSAKVKSPVALAHIVLRTARYPEMVNYYKTFLGAETTFTNEYLTLLTYDEEHHRVAILSIPDTTDKLPGSAGMHHVAFTFPTLDDLALSYSQRKEHGIVPARCINHGPTTSIYYSDPDGNMVETQVDNFDTPQETTDFMTGPLFAQNPIGADFEPEDLIRRLKSGESHVSIKERDENGPVSAPF